MVRVALLLHGYTQTYLLTGIHSLSLFPMPWKEKNGCRNIIIAYQFSAEYLAELRVDAWYLVSLLVEKRYFLSEVSMTGHRSLPVLFPDFPYSINIPLTAPKNWLERGIRSIPVKFITLRITLQSSWPLALIGNNLEVKARDWLPRQKSVNQNPTGGERFWREENCFLPWDANSIYRSIRVANNLVFSDAQKLSRLLLYSLFIHLFIYRIRNIF